MKKPLWLILALLAGGLSAAGPKIFWGDSVPDGWNGRWPEALRTRAESSEFSRTSSSLDILTYIDQLRWRSDSVHVFNMYVSAQGRACPVLVLASPRVTTPEEAVRSGKTVIYLQGNIHPSEAEAKEALLLLAREILLGSLRPLLDRLVVLICPSFNMDGNDTWSLAEGTPHLLSGGTNALGFNLNRDAIKLETPEVQALCRTVLNRWDPVLLYDGHAMENVQHGYAIAYATSSVPAAHPGPRDYVWDTMFPELRRETRARFGLETFTHCGLDERWPPTAWSHEGAAWSTEAKFVAAAAGLRNRMSILAETPMHLSFRRKIYAQYALLAEILAYASRHGREMADVCRAADRDVVEAVRTRAVSGGLTNFTAGRFESRGRVDVLAYREKNAPGLVPGTSVRALVPAALLGPPELVRGLEDRTRAVGTASARVPRGYLLPAELDFLVEKLRLHNIKVETLTRPIRASGEQFVVDRLSKNRRGGLALTAFEGAFGPFTDRVFPAGTFRVDLAQPAANLAFYCLEPLAADGFAACGLLDGALGAAGTAVRSVVYPVYKYFQIEE